MRLNQSLPPKFPRLLKTPAAVFFFQTLRRPQVASVSVIHGVVGDSIKAAAIIVRAPL